MAVLLCCVECAVFGLANSGELELLPALNTDRWMVRLCQVRVATAVEEAVVSYSRRQNFRG